MAEIKTWLVRGDCHGTFYWMHTRLREYERETTAIIILGDAGLNYYLNKIDERLKKEIDRLGYYLYIIRGNHEARPQDISGMELWYDDNVGGNVYWELKYPHIRYFQDYGVYWINGYKCAIVGGAYSVDKWWRLARVGITDESDLRYKDITKSGWFYNEQLSNQEMIDAENCFKENGPYYDFLLCHTCPKKFQPIDLFLETIDQSKVDNSMEVWLDKIYRQFMFGVTLFGHYHADRIEAPYVEQYYNHIEELSIIWDRWVKYSKTGKLDWWLSKSYNYYKYGE